MKSKSKRKEAHKEKVKQKKLDKLKTYQQKRV